MQIKKINVKELFNVLKYRNYGEYELIERIIEYVCCGDQVYKITIYDRILKQYYQCKFIINEFDDPPYAKYEFANNNDIQSRCESGDVELIRVYPHEKIITEYTTEEL